MTTSVRQLLRDLDRMSFVERQCRLASLAHQLRGTAELDDLLAGLDVAGAPGRQMAGALAKLAGHLGHLERSLDSAVPGEVLHALEPALRHGLSVEALVDRVVRWPPALRHAAYRTVRRLDRTDAADALLPAVQKAWGDADAGRLLAACSPPVVAAQLPHLEHAVTGWTTLARRHPALFLDHVQTELRAAPTSTWSQVLHRLGPGIGAAVLAEPDRVLELLEQLVGRVALPALTNVGVLARRHPHRVLALLVHPFGAGSMASRPAVWRAVLPVNDDDLVRLGRLLAAQGHRSWRNRSRFAAFMRVLPPSRRAAVYRGVLGGHDLVSDGVPLSVLDDLPLVARAEEAARLLTLRSTSADPATRLAVTARLHWTDAEAALRQATRRADAEERAAAYGLLVAAAAGSRDPGVLADVLGSLTRLANEQDAVRGAVLQAVACVPGWLMDDTAADAVGRLLATAMQARDTSWSTVQHATAICRTLLREGSAHNRPALVRTAVGAFTLLASSTRHLPLQHLDQGLPRGAEHWVLAALRPRLTADARRGQYGVALALADGLRRRAWAMPDLQALLDAAREAKGDETVRRAVALWLQPPSTRGERVERVLRADPSTITLSSVQRVVGRQRTDLLDSALGHPTTGRFLDGTVRYVPPFDAGFDRWLPRQVTAYADLLVGVATTADAPAHQRVSAIARLGRLPGTDSAVRAFVASSETAVAEAALGAMVRADDPAAALEVLLGQADGDRARVAMPAATRCARFVPATVLTERLRPLAHRSKVTSRKEAIRLLAEHRVPGAVDVLLEVWATPRQHRDVRRAVVSAARHLLDDPRTWQMLDDAATQAEEVSTSVLGPAPTTMEERYRVRYAGLVLSVASSTDTRAAKRGLAALPGWVRWEPRAASMLLERITDLEDAAVWRSALQAAVAVAAGARDADLLREAVVRLVELDTGRPGGAPEHDRDLPARQRVLVLVEAARSQAALRRWWAPARVLSEHLSEHCEYRWTAVELATVAVDWLGTGTALRDLLRVAELADRPVLAHRASEAVGAGLRSDLSRIPPEELLSTARSLASAGSSAAVLAVALVAAGGPDAGWPAPWRDLLHELRRHPDVDARLPALEVFASVE